MLDNKSQPKLGNQSLNLWQNPETLLTGGLLIVVTIVAWAVVILQAAQMQNMSGSQSDMPDTNSSSMVDPMAGMAMTDSSNTANSPPDKAPFTSNTSNSLSMALVDAAGYLIAWGVMMAAMMLPSAAPMIVLYGTVKSKFSLTGQRGIPAVFFALIYLVLWLAFGIPVYIVSTLIDSAVIANPSLVIVLPYALALMLLAAGAFQFSALKRICLQTCRSPISFLLGRWRSGYRGTSRIAIEHAAYCIGCCWGLMVVLVAAGAMALEWVLLIAALVFVEKLLPRGELTARLIGGALMLFGLLVVIQPELMMTLPG
jgi:predicted metal-binding membrane protein